MHFSDQRITRLGIKHCIIQADLGPVQLKVSLDESGAISINCVDIRQRLFLGIPAVIRLRILDVREAQERPKRILTITRKILRASANDYAWKVRNGPPVRKRRRFGAHQAVPTDPLAVGPPRMLL